MTKLMLLALGVVWFGPATPDGFLCRATGEVGFEFNTRTRKWQPAIHTPSRQWTVIRPPTEFRAAWVVKFDGTIILTCVDEIDQSTGYLYCAVPGGNPSVVFQLDAVRLRYSFMSEAGYVLNAINPATKLPAVEEGGIQPVLEIGTCKAL